MSSRRERHLAALGLSRDAGIEAIKGAYRQLAKEFHPDRRPDLAPEDREALDTRFLEIQSAYEALLQPVRCVRLRRHRSRWRLAWLLIPVAAAGLVVWLLLLLLNA
jgi:hypothetical protein